MKMSSVRIAPVLKGERSKYIFRDMPIRTTYALQCSWVSRSFVQLLKQRLVIIYSSEHISPSTFVTYFASLLPSSSPTALRNEISKSDVFAL